MKSFTFAALIAACSADVGRVLKFHSGTFGSGNAALVMGATTAWSVKSPMDDVVFSATNESAKLVPGEDVTVTCVVARGSWGADTYFELDGTKHCAGITATTSFTFTFSPGPAGTKHRWMRPADAGA